MKSKILIFGISLITLFMVLITTSTPQTNATLELYIFGDSLSDIDNSFRASGGQYPPNPAYFQGRYSNGKVWVEYLADRLQLPPQKVHNFAYGGATTGSVEGSIPSLVTQVQSFNQTSNPANSEALYILWAGANDYLQGMNRANIPVEMIMTAIANLKQAGAQKFLIANLPDLGQLPATRNTANSTPLSSLTQSHNQALRRSLKVFQQQHSQVEIASLDIYVLYRQAMTNPNSLGFTNVINSCFSGSRACPNPKQYLFWDSIHPTTAAHRVIGEAAFAAIQESGIASSPISP